MDIERMRGKKTTTKPTTIPTDEFDKPISSLKRLGKKEEAGLARLGLHTLRDLLYHFPAKYLESADVRPISEVTDGETAVVYGRITKIESGKAWRSKVPLAKAVINDESRNLYVTWLHQPYFARMFEVGAVVKVMGKVAERNGSLTMMNPSIENADIIPRFNHDSLFSGKDEPPVPIYPETRSLSSRWFAARMQNITSSPDFNHIKDPLPDAIRTSLRLPDLRTALLFIHQPRTDKDWQAARKRFAFEEMFRVALRNEHEKQLFAQYKSFIVPDATVKMLAFAKKLPFKLTNAQLRTLQEIADDISDQIPMARLVEGDVGSGKTAIAALTAQAVISTPPVNDQKFSQHGRLQVALMAPTQILAEQHFATFMELFADTGISISLVTGNGAKKFPSKLDPRKPTKISRAQHDRWVKNGEISIVIGTHALIYDKLQFRNLAFVVVDEQHRFGTRTRAKLRGKDDVLPHLLSMTATPIPRTLALAAFGDLDLSVIDELPPGRRQVKTNIINPLERKKIYQFMREELIAGRQAYVICPRVQKPDPDLQSALQVASVEEETKKLQKLFSDFSVGALHGQMKPAEKDAVMKQFNDHKIDILVSTTVVEVGVNVPNANIIVIEGAERYGLSQLHQLRGRVQRGNHQPYCFLFTEAKSEATKKRLALLEKSTSGFELAEADLQLRGPGDLAGRKQSGLSDLAMEALKNIKLVEVARTEAKKLLEKDPELKNHPDLKHVIEEKSALHLE